MLRKLTTNYTNTSGHLDEKNYYLHVHLKRLTNARHFLVVGVSWIFHDAIMIDLCFFLTILVTLPKYLFIIIVN